MFFNLLNRLPSKFEIITTSISLHKLKSPLEYERDRLASLAITLRGLDLCGDPFPVSALTSVPSVMNEYLYTRRLPGSSGSGPTEAVYVANRTMKNIT